MMGDADDCDVELVDASDAAFSETISADTAPNNPRTRGGREFGSEADTLEQELAKQQTSILFWLRVVVMASLLITALVVCVTVFINLREAEMEEFEAHFEGISAKVLQAFNGIVEQKLVAVGSVEVAAIAQSLVEERGWPFVTLSFFQERAASARSLSGSLFLSISPVVNASDRSEWEDYVREQNWM